MKKLVVLSGPSCVGKGPLRAALKRHHPEIQYAEPLLCHSRIPRLKKNTNTYEIHGVDYYFLPRGILEQLDRTRFAVANIRSEIQALDLIQLRRLFKDHDVVLVEAYPTLAKMIIKWASQQEKKDIRIRSVFLLPLAGEEIQEMAKREKQSPEEVVYHVMKEKLARRGEDSPESIETRAASAFREMQYASDYTDRIVNHAGEDDIEAWTDPLSPEAQRVLEEFTRVFITQAS